MLDRAVPGLSNAGKAISGGSRPNKIHATHTPKSMAGARSPAARIPTPTPNNTIAM